MIHEFHDAHHPADVLAFIHSEQALGLACALIIVSDIRGGTLRAKGALMGVSRSGTIAGYISNGCVDADIIAHAHRCLEANKATSLLYGEGSPFPDIALPCGGAIEVSILPNPEPEAIIRASDKLKSRNSTKLGIPNFQGLLYQPKLRIRIVGRGALVRSLAAQSAQSGFEVQIQSPDIELQSLSNTHPLISFKSLTNPQTPPPCEDDKWTALALMFHDHDWESEILKQALNGPAFYFGALGSPRTHLARCATLHDMGIGRDQTAKIHGPIGLIGGMRDANLLAISTLAEIVKTAQGKNLL